MFELELNSEDKCWLKKEHPDLKIDLQARPSIIFGILKFDMFYNFERKNYILNPPEEFISNPNRIKDEYNIEVFLIKTDSSLLPPIREAGQRIKSVAATKKKKLEDLHINKDGSVCLCFKKEEKDYLPRGFNLEDFFKNLVIPFFYAQSFYEENNSWPWGEYSHGNLALPEWFIEKNKGIIKIKIVKNYLYKKEAIKGDWPCICGSSSDFRNCHKELFRTLRLIKNRFKNPN